MPTLVLVSDTHGRHRDLIVPDGDVFIHAGDMTMFAGELDVLVDFNDYLETLPHAHKIVVAGNHDFCFERDNARSRALLTNATYLEDDAITIDGVTYYGSPWQPEFLNWAFNLERGKALREKWSMVPDHTDVLITHCPPAGILDETIGGERVGCEDLLARVRVVRPKLHVFGHIHEARGMVEIDGTKFVNAATAFRSCEPFVVEM
ncbi:MAG: metallophosphatase domain-containing protein [Candidatus Krumholzibacteriota bacterium]|nr:metallophosphatase domain-containing protein [Candidatus Krumholzibacteriota bacterium]